MPIVTYMSPGSEPALKSEDVAKLLAEVRKVSGKHVIVEETETVRRRWFRTVTRRLYQVLWPLDGCEHQIINFGPGEGSESSINTWVPEQVVTAWMLGLVSGYGTVNLEL